MNFTFEDLTALRNEWQALQPLSPENEERLWQKLRINWNYHSNHIEGNTLTYGETELLLLRDRTTGNHDMREYLEMKAHDLGIEHVRTLAAGQARLLSESDIRDLNRIILKEPYWKAAETADGQPTRKQIIPGQYKTTPNNVRLPNGEKFFFASVEDTPARMSALVADIRSELEKPTLHPVTFAAKLHHEFVVIHPFDDGNGRVARLLVNYTLLRNGYLPVIVPTEDKKNYLAALQQADSGDPTALIRYFATLTEKSLRLGIKAAKGQDIREASDLFREIEIHIRNQEPHRDRIKKCSPGIVRELMDLGLRSLVFQTVENIQKLEKLFTNTTINAQPPAGNGPAAVATALDTVTTDPIGCRHLTINFTLHGYNGHAPEPFNEATNLIIGFDEYHYRIIADNNEILKRLYTEPLLSDEAEGIANNLLARVFDRIKAKCADPAP